jgi:benzylsuccinate CoA-transferase BbsE subunit
MNLGSPVNGENEMNSLLGHLLVLDLADETASYCSMLLGRLGANIIKIEKPGGDPSRYDGPLVKTGKGTSSLSFLYNNAGKKGITLNLETRAGRDLFRKLAGRADVVIETFPAGYLRRKRLDYNHLKSLNPGLILASVSPFGRSGPGKSWAADNAVISAAAGLTNLHGDLQSPPADTAGNQTGYLSSLFAISGILLAVQNRNATGLGQNIDISMQEASASLLVNPFIRFFSEGVDTHRNGRMRWDNMAGIFPCSDGFIFITFDREWDILVELMASDGFNPPARPAEWADPLYRRQHHARINEAITAWTLTYRVSQLFELGQSMRFPWAPVSDMSSLLKNPQLESRGYFCSLSQADSVRDIPAPGIPYEFDGERGKMAFKTPLAGEHNHEVYRQLLSLSEKEISRLERNNVI